MSINEIFEKKITNKLNANSELAQEISKIIAIELTGNESGIWIIDCKSSPAKIEKKEDVAADMTITMDSSDFVAMTSGDLNPQMAFLGGKIKVKGDISLAIKLGQILS